MSITEQEGIYRGFGKSSQSGIPHKGWTCTSMYDLDDDRMICEMCASAEIRYVHVMTHPQFSGELEVGCICAGRMEQDLASAETREKDFKRRQNPRVANAMMWFEAAQEILNGAGDLTPRSEFLSPLDVNWTADRGKLKWDEYNLVSDIVQRAAYCARPRVRQEFFIYADDIVRFYEIYRRIVGKDHYLIGPLAESCEKKLRTQREAKEKLEEDNRVGLKICETLLTKPLRERELDFIASIKKQILDRFGEFEISERQHAWLRDIWRKYGQKVEADRIKEGT